MERWKSIPGWNSRYEASSEGRVRNIQTGNILKGDSNQYGHRCIRLGSTGDLQKVQVGRLVLLAFRGLPPTEKHECRHLDGIPRNNTLGNLKWGISKQNHADRRLHGTSPIGERNNNAVLDEKKVRSIRDEAAILTERKGSKHGVYATLGRKHGVTSKAIGYIVRGERWAHLSS